MILSLQRVVKLSKPTDKWIPAIEKEGKSSLTPKDPPPPYSVGLNKVGVDDTSYSNPAFTGSTANVADSNTYL